MRRCAAAWLLSLSLAACGGVDARDFAADRSAPRVDRFEAVDAAGAILASAVRRPGMGTICPDGRQLLGSRIEVARPIAGLLMTIKDDDSGVRKVVISVAGARPSEIASAAGSFELLVETPDRPAMAFWRAAAKAEPREIILRVPISPSARIGVTVEAQDASGKSITTETLTFATLAALCE